MVIYQSRFLVRGEVWYDQEPDARPVDWLLYRQRSLPVPGGRWKYFHTLLIDLRQSPDVLLEQMSKSTVTKLKRARDKDGIVCERLEPAVSESRQQFLDAYNRFAVTKGLDALERSELDGLADEGLLDLSVVRSQGGEPLVYHAFYRDPDRCCFLHSASLHRTYADSGVRNAIGRANVYLFWSDMLRHKAAGVKCFDFGGWYPGDSDQQLLGVNRFKAGFGGQLVRKYNCERIVSLKGRVLLTIARFFRRARGQDDYLAEEPEEMVPAPVQEPQASHAVSPVIPHPGLERIVAARRSFAGPPPAHTLSGPSIVQPAPKLNQARG